MEPKGLINRIGCFETITRFRVVNACGEELQLRDHGANGANPCPGYHTGRCFEEGLITVDPCVDHDAFGCHSSRVSQ